jgi:GT2 family glycosyltransferase
MGLPKVLVFTVTYEGKDYCFKEFLEHAKKLTYKNKRHIFIDNSHNMHYYLKLQSLGLEVYRTERGNNTREAIARSQNLARKIALDEGYDYILSLESDVMVCPDVIERLMGTNHNVVSALYFIGDKAKGERVPCLTIPEFKHDYGYFGTRLLKVEEWGEYVHKGLQRVQAAALGCCLIHRSVFEKIRFMYEVGLKGHSDIYFFNDCFAKKIPVYVQTDIVLDHQNSLWSNVEDR